MYSLSLLSFEEESVHPSHSLKGSVSFLCMYVVEPGGFHVTEQQESPAARISEIR